MERRGLLRRISLRVLTGMSASFTIAVVCLLVPAFGGSAPAAESARPHDGPGKLESLKEANRVLEEEIKLASRQQIYLILDLPEQVIRIKSRGVELFNLPVLAWRMSEGSSAGAYRLRARPEVSRPRAAPDASLEPINVEDMPAEYVLEFDPGLLVMVAPPARKQAWLWMRSKLREWWMRAMSRLRAGSARASTGPVFRLTLSPEAARSLAWSVTDGMPLLINRPATP